MVLKKILNFLIRKYDELVLKTFEKKVIDNPTYLNQNIEHSIFSRDWEDRIDRIKFSPYNQNIPRVDNAGKVIDNFQVMHNGLLIKVGGYYGLPITKALYVNKGVHEPFEEYWFYKILKDIKSEAPVILELGAYWSFYSMWFLKEKQHSTAFLIEPEMENLEIGKSNFAKNGFKGHFFQYFIDEISSGNMISVDDFVEQQKITEIDILHVDIQGAEMKMLKGAKNTIANKKAQYLFISTHSNELHYECVNHLENNGYVIIDHLDLNYSDCYDGIIISKIKD